MGSYANIFYYDSTNQCKIVATFDHKFYGYIEDEEIEKTLSYQWLMKIKALRYDVEMRVNYSYIGTVLKLPLRKMLEFMALYALDYALLNKTVDVYGIFDWSFDDVPADLDTPVFLSFD